MSDPHASITSIPMEQQAIRAKCFHPSGTFVEFKEEEVEQSIPQRFETIVGKYPNCLAVKTKTRAVTYDELNKRANRVARAILTHGRDGKKPIGLLFEHDIDVLVGILGTLKAGKFYLVLDPAFPLERMTHVLDDSQANLILTNNQNLCVADKLRRDSRHLLNIDELDESLSNANLGLAVSPDALAYLIYTSGSTGKPKGVLQNHLNMLHEVMVYTNGFRICAQDRLTLLASCSSGQGTKNAFCALLNGAGLYSLDIKSEGIDRLAEYLTQEQITMYHSSVALFRTFLKTLTGRERFPCLRLIRLASQEVFKEDVEFHKPQFSPACIFVNALSSTETGTFRWYFMKQETGVQEGTVPVGYAVEDKEILLLDERNREVGVNEVGEIAVKSRYLSPGYWRRPYLNQRKFLPDPNQGNERLYLTGDLGRILPDGCLVYLGRKDLRVKVRGYGVELGEIERTLLAHPGVKEAAVVAWDRERGEKYLVAYVVPQQEPIVTIKELRDVLKKELPDYMIPSTFMILDALPLTPGGKVDRRALPDPGRSRPELDSLFVAPRTQLEEELSQIWAEVLFLDRVGIHDDFFELGGHSLAATSIVSRTVKRFQVEVPLQLLFEAPTVAEMANVITAHQAKKLEKQDLNSILAELESLTEDEAKKHLVDTETM
jgi:amino acid adenylation domain-containing protein